MLIMTRKMDLDGLVEKVRGKRVGIWTCRTCARLCDGLGGDEAAERLESALEERGIEVCGRASTSASCLWDKVERALADDPFRDAEVIIPLTCDVAAKMLESFSDALAVDCVLTRGRGGLSEEKEPLLMGPDGSWTRLGGLEDAQGLRGPFV